jgi:antitoxin component YwqK of YwqJK toxin-antitoxin module
LICKTIINHDNMKIQIQKSLLLLLMVTSAIGAIAQKKTFFDINWKKTKEAKAYYYRVVTPEGSNFLVQDYFSKSNQLQMEGRYKSKKLESSSRDGIFTYYWSNGKKKAEGEYKNGKEDGNWVSWHFDGEKRAEGLYEKGDRQGAWKFFHKNGQLKTNPTFLDDEKDGASTFYYDNGDKLEDARFAKGKLDGEFTVYHKGGKVKTKGKYVKDSLEGTYEHYWENGNMSYKGDYSDNKRNGQWEFFHNNGKKSCEVEYKKGKFIKASFFDEEGAKLSKKVYEEDLVKDCEFTGGSDAMYDIIIKQIQKKVELTEAKKDKIYFFAYCVLTLDTEGNIIDRNWTYAGNTLEKEFSLPVAGDDFDVYVDPYDIVKNVNSAIDDFPKFQPGKAYNRQVSDTYAVVYILNYKKIN